MSTTKETTTQNDPKVPDHYKMGGELHWDRQWRLYGRAYFVGQITKYVERYHRKAGLKDLRKLVHFCEKLEALERAAAMGTGPLGGVNGVEGMQPPVNLDETTPAPSLKHKTCCMGSTPVFTTTKEELIKAPKSSLPSERTIVQDNHGFGHVELGGES